jgi:hypothetical protein
MRALLAFCVISAAAVQGTSDPRLTPEEMAAGWILLFDGKSL